MVRYQTFGKRVIAALVDLAVWLPLIFVGIWVELADLDDWTYFTLLVIQTPIGLAYNILLHWKFGQTVGKMVAKVKVIDLNEGPLSFGQAVLRDIAYVADALVSASNMALLFSFGFSRTSEFYTSIQSYMLIPLFCWIFIDTLVCVKSKKNRALHDFCCGNGRCQTRRSGPKRRSAPRAAES